MRATQSTMRGVSRCLGLVVLTFFVVMPAKKLQAQGSVYGHFQGYAWHDPSEGEHGPLNMVMTADALAASFGDLLDTHEVTFWVTGLTYVAQVQWPPGSPGVVMLYTGGSVVAYADDAQDHAYGVSPPNATVPDTFINGTMVLRADLEKTSVSFRPDLGSGKIELALVNVESAALENLPAQLSSPHFSLALEDGSLTSPDVPSGFDYRVEGVLQYFILTAVEESTFSKVKALFR